MDQNNLDRLFREKMDGLEVRPSANAWAQVEKQLKPNRKPAYYWIAATIALFAISWILMPSQSDFKKQFAAIEITHPPMLVMEPLEIPVAVTLTEKQEIQKNTSFKSPKNGLSAVVAVNSQSVLTREKGKEASPAIKLESKTSLIAEVSETIPLEELAVESIETKKEVVRSTVKITYIASNQKNTVSEYDNTPDSTSKFKKFIAFAEKIDPGEMLADIKTAKDNLLNSGFKSKKDKSVMNP